MANTIYAAYTWVTMQAEGGGTELLRQVAGINDAKHPAGAGWTLWVNRAGVHRWLKTGTVPVSGKFKNAAVEVQAYQDELGRYHVQHTSASPAA
jgi:hypothetical protein